GSFHLAVPVVLLGLHDGHQWRYLDNDTDPGANWFSTSFDDSAWPSGAQPFDAKRSGVGTAPFMGDANNCRPETYYGLGAVGTCLKLTSPVTGTNAAQYYFRTHLGYLRSHANAVLQLS